MTDTTYTSAADAAAAWWAQQISAPTFRAVGENSSPQEHEAMGFAGGLAGMLADRHPVTREAADMFAAALTRRISKALEYGPVHLAVDYHPGMLLAQASQAAGIHPSRFPWKTHVSVHSDYVTAALGYGAPQQLIWQHPGWVRPVCGTYRYDHTDAGYKLHDEQCSKPRYHDGRCSDWQPSTDRCVVCSRSYVDHHALSGRLDHYWSPKEAA